MMALPVLSRTNAAQVGGIAGAFTFTEDWGLTNRLAGVILQKISRTLTVQEKVDAGGVFTNPYTMDQATAVFETATHPLYLNTLVYWELFDVPAAGAIHGDQFQSNWFARTLKTQPVASTKGAYTIVGEARFYATNATHAVLGFNGHLPIAAGLSTTTNDPSANFAGLVASNQIVRTVTSSWSCDVVTNGVKAVTQLTVT